MYARKSTGPMTEPQGTQERTATKSHHYRLLPIFKEGFNPLQSVTSNTLVIILQFIKKSVMRNIIEGLRKDQYDDISLLST